MIAFRALLAFAAAAIVTFFVGIEITSDAECDGVCFSRLWIVLLCAICGGAVAAYCTGRFGGGDQSDRGA